MGTAATIPLTKPRISAMVLEGTATAVSVTLVLWLLLWFIHQHAKQNQIAAYYVQVEGIPIEEVPAQAADVRALAESYGSGGPPATKASNLITEIQNRIKSGTGPLVIYVSAPVLGTGPDAKIGGGPSVQELIGTLNDAQRVVVLALDFAQVDTDRELRTFGNAPYWGLDDAINAVTKRGGNRFVLTSAARAQKSWAADGLRQSVFAYYLREGLKGEARGWDARESDAVTVYGLYRYVLHHVQEWVQIYRGSRQTPVLWPAPTAESRPLVKLRSIRISSPASSSVTETASKLSDVSTQTKAETSGTAGPAEEKTEKDAKAAEPALSPVDAALMGLLTEWNVHDGLRAKQPFAVLPGTWREYQTSLLRAERLLRTAWLDPKQLERAQTGLKEAQFARQKLTTEMAKQEQSDQATGFRAIAGDSEDDGKRTLQKSSLLLTGQGLDVPRLTPRSRDHEKADAPFTEPGKVPMGAQPAKVLSQEPPPRELEKVTPDTYLELQLLGWAYRFTIAFDRPGYFKNNLRGQILRDLVEARADAELALALDRRGVGSIESAIVRGDKIRRKLQDELLSATIEDSARDHWNEDIKRVRAIYTDVLRSSTRFREARETYQKAAVELPALVEWEIRTQPAKQLPTDPIPELSRQTLSSFETLAKVLNDESGNDEKQTPSWFGELGNAREQTRRNLTALSDRLRDSVAGRSADIQQWTSIDAALRSPLLEAEQRGKLLRSLRELPEPAVKLAPPDNDDGSVQVSEARDPGFWIRAAGLAQLDMELRRIANEPDHRDDKQLVPKLWKDTWSQTISDFASPEDNRVRFPDFTAAADKGRNQPASLLGGPDQSVPRKRDAVGLSLRERDRWARLLDSRGVHETGTVAVDDAALRYHRLGHFATLDLQLARLREDYADGATLAKLAKDIEDLAKPLGIGWKVENLSTGNLRISVTPANLKLPLKNWEGEITAGLTEPLATDGFIPEGEAFIGVVVPQGLSVDGVSAESPTIPGTQVEVGMPSDTTERPPSKRHKIEQQDYVPNKSYPVKAKVFYRGHVDDQYSAVQVSVQGDDSEPVEVKIGQDRELWKSKYGEKVAREIRDQFADHQGEGYMHLGRSLDYVLTLHNRTLRQFELWTTIEFVDPASPAQKKPQPEKFTLGPKGSMTMRRGKVSMSPINQEDTRELTVILNGANHEDQVKNASPKIQRDPFKVTFRQIGIDKYMSFSTDFSDQCVHDGQNFRCFQVSFDRLIGDKFTEPIKAGEWKCVVDGREVVTNFDKNDWILPGQGYEFHYRGPNATPDCKWFGRIENEEKRGVGVEKVEKPK